MTGLRGRALTLKTVYALLSVSSSSKIEERERDKLQKLSDLYTFAYLFESEKLLLCSFLADTMY